MIRLCSFFLFVSFFYSCNSQMSGYKALVGQWLPDAVCNIDEPNDSDEIYGIEINLLKKIYDQVGWVEGEDFYYQCVSWGDGWSSIDQDQNALWFPATTTNYERLSLGRVFAQVPFFFLFSLL